MLPCILTAACVGRQVRGLDPEPDPQTVTKNVDLFQAGQPPKVFTVTLTIPAKLRQGVGTA